MAARFPATITEIRDYPAAQVRRIFMQPETMPPYRAGQYMQLGFAGLPARPFSIGTRPGSDTIEFHIRNSGSPVSVYATTELKVGERVTLSEACGDAVYVPACTRPLIAVAGGSGLAPMKAIIEEALADPRRTAPAHLYWGGATAEDLYMHEDFLVLAEKDTRFIYHPVLSEQDMPGFAHGLVGDVMAGDIKDLGLYRMYGAGSEAMLRHFEALMQARGVDPALVHTDLKRMEKTDER